ncbi:MAG: YidB family protein [Casimicrobiaceae bacterium]
MGLLDSVLGAVLSGGRGGGQQDLIGSLLGGLIQQAGGVGGLLDKFRQAGLGQQADSWQGTGANLPIDPEDLMRVLGGLGGGQACGQGGGGGMGDLLGQMMSGMGQGSGSAGGLGALLGQGGSGGADSNQLFGLLAQALPQVIDKMTPGGQLPQNESPDMLQSVLGEVMKNMGGGQGGRGLFG